MTEEARNARNAYRRKWAKENQDKVRAQQERYWAKRARENAVINQGGNQKILEALKICLDAAKTKEEKRTIRELMERNSK